MGFITNDRRGIPEKKVYACIARALKKGLFAPRRIDEDLARSCTDLDGLVSDEITNLDFLSFFPNLTDLHVASANLSDVRGLRYVPNMDWLQITNHSIRDITPLDHCRKLTFLQMDSKNEGRAGMGSPAKDWGVIERLHELTILSLNGNHIDDISWITGLQKLKFVALSRNPITDFSPLLQLGDLGELELDATQKQYIDERYGHIAIEYIS